MKVDLSTFVLWDMSMAVELLIQNGEKVFLPMVEEGNGVYYFSTEYVLVNSNNIKQIWFRYETVNANDSDTYVRTKIGGA